MTEQGLDGRDHALTPVGGAEAVHVDLPGSWTTSRALRASRALRTSWVGQAVKAAGLPAAAMGVLIWVTVALFRSGGPARPHLYAEFVDASSCGCYLDVQLDRSVTSYGAFSVFFPQEGRVWPAAGVETTPGRDGAVTLDYHGVGYRQPPARPDNGSGEEPPGRAGPPQVVRLRLVGQVDAGRRTTSVDVWVNGNHHHLGSPGEATGAEAVASDVLAALRVGDWVQLYGIENRYMRNGTARSDFVATLAASNAGRRITGAETSGPTRYSTSAAGVSSARIPIRLTFRTGSGTTVVPATLVLVVDEGAWRLLSVE